MFIPNFFCRQGGLGGPHGWGGPPSAEISRHQPKPAEISHHQPQGGGGGPFQLENRWPRGVGANFLGVGPIGPPPTPLQLENSWPRRQLPGAYGGGPQRGVPYRPGSVNSYGLGLGNSGIVYKQIGKGIVFERDFWKGFLKRLLGELRINASYFWENDFQKNPTLSPKCVPNQSIFTNKPKHICGHIVVEKIR